jgi:DNA modification methylase
MTTRLGSCVIGFENTSERTNRETYSDELQVLDPRNKLNDLSTTEWVARTVSVFAQKGLGESSKEARFEKLHPAPFSFQDISRFIEFFTKAGQTVLDPFVGVASTLKASALLGRNSIGIELNKTFAKLGQTRLVAEVDPEILRRVKAKIITGDVRKKVAALKNRSVDFIVTSPPYWGILNKVDHKAKQERLSKGRVHNYGNDRNDLARIERYEDFVGELTEVFSQLSLKLAARKYAVVIVGDFRDKSRYHMFHADLANAMEKSGRYTLKGITVLYQKHKRVFPYGYPYAYVPNLHHQYALVFQKAHDAE